MFVIALAKGRLLEPSLELLSRAGIRFAEDATGSRKLIFDSEDGRHRIVLVKPADVPTYVEYGAADAGIACLDVLLESRADLIQPLRQWSCDLIVRFVRVAASPEDWAIRRRTS